MGFDNLVASVSERGLLHFVVASEFVCRILARFRAIVRIISGHLC